MENDTSLASPATPGTEDEDKIEQIMTVKIGQQTLGIEVSRVSDVIISRPCTPVPMTPSYVLGVVNLRGHIVTVLDVRQRLDIQDPLPEGHEETMCVVVEVYGEMFGLIVDSIGDVLSFPRTDRQPVPPNLDKIWQTVARGVYRLPNLLVVMIEPDHILDDIGPLASSLPLPAPVP
jgi:purine-binding chemotaxis protein CheW